jgi:hypothetical protein
MSKQAVDLSLDELAALGANAALQAAKRAQDAGLSTLGTVDFLEEEGQAKSVLAERRPSGAIALRTIDVTIEAEADEVSDLPLRPGFSG